MTPPQSLSSRLVPWLLAARPKTLSAAAVPVLAGTALVPHGQPIRWDLFLFALLGSFFIQIGTNLVNDALDFRKGADTADRVGPRRVTQAGLISEKAVLRGAYGCFALAAVCGVPLIVRGGWPLVIIGVASIFSAYIYTGGPYPLAYHGLGEPFVLLFFGFVAVGGTYYLQTLRLSEAALLTGFAVGTLAVLLLAINNLRDIASDRATNKWTLAARFGERFAFSEVVSAALIPFASVALLCWRIGRWTPLIVLLGLPLAIAIIRRVAISKGAALNQCLAMSGGLQWLFGLLLVIGLRLP